MNKYIKQEHNPGRFTLHLSTPSRPADSLTHPFFVRKFLHLELSYKKALNVFGIHQANELSPFITQKAACPD